MQLQNLEGQVTEHESKVKQLQADNGRLSTELTTCQQAKDALQAEHTDALGECVCVQCVCNVCVCGMGQIQIWMTLGMI